MYGVGSEGHTSYRGNNHAWNELGRALHPEEPFPYSIVLNIVEVACLHKRRAGPNQGRVKKQILASVSL